MAKKMILVDPSHMLLKTSPVPDTLSDTVLSIDDEIRNILESSNYTDHDKASAYQQALQRYLTRVGQVNKRGPNLFPTSQQKAIQESTPVQSGDNSDNVADGKSDKGPDVNNEKILKLEERLIQSVPVTLSKKAKLLLGHIKDTTNLTWNERGEIISNGQPVAGSNLQDLVHETVRARKHLGDAPIGWDTFSRFLRTSNVPLDLIGNKSRWNSNDTSETDRSRTEDRVTAKKRDHSSWPRRSSSSRSRQHHQRQGSSRPKEPFLWLSYKK